MSMLSVSLRIAIGKSHILGHQINLNWNLCFLHSEVVPQHEFSDFFVTIFSAAWRHLVLEECDDLCQIGFGGGDRIFSQDSFGVL